MPVDANSSSSSYDMLDDPLYLSNSDQPVLQLVTNQFNGSDFVSWKRDVYHALVVKNKEGFIDGTCKTPAKTDKKYHQWIRCDLLVMKWILNSVVKSIRETLQYASSSKELWTEICDRYGQTNSIEIYELKKDLGSLTQENSSLVDYYSKCKRTWESIDALDPIPLCTCGALDTCTCQMLKRLVEREVNAKLIQFLMGLNDAYESVKTHVLSLEPLPTLNKAFSRLQKIECQKHIHVTSDMSTDAAAFTSSIPNTDFSTSVKKARTQLPSDSTEVKECHYCHNLGHTKAGCFKLKECSFCGKKGHARETCFRLKYGSSNSNKSYRGRGRGYNTAGHNSIRRGANHADVVIDYNDPISEDGPTDPLTDSHIQTENSDFDAHLMPGLVSTVVEQEMKAISEKKSGHKNVSGLSSANFAGPYK